jgi:hypothetical protein
MWQIPSNITVKEEQGLACPLLGYSSFPVAVEAYRLVFVTGRAPEHSATFRLTGNLMNQPKRRSAQQARNKWIRFAYGAASAHLRLTS